ncbi:MAG: MauE/DoxX family redox-associated membrane protein [Bacillota bacterium]
MITHLVFSIGVGFLLMLSGLLKAISIRDSVESVVKLNIIPKRLSKVVGYSFPFIEVILGLSLIFFYNLIIVNILVLGIIFAFTFINYKITLERKRTNCSCFGKLVKSELGYGGLAQSLLMLLSILPAIVFESNNLFIQIGNQLKVFDFFIVLIASLLWSATLFVIRIIFDLLFNNRLAEDM